MGFFKKALKGLKGITKMISIKNIKNVATGNYGGLAKELAGRVKNGLIGEFTRKSKPAANLSMQNDAQDIAMLVKQNPNIRDILSGALGGAMTGAGTVLSGSNDINQAGANAVDGVAGAWFKKNWLKLVGGITAGTLLVVGIVKLSKPKNGRR